jgi:creatinine amidohydrolase
MTVIRHWQEMGWQDFSAAEVARLIAVMPVAAIEQHGPHLPVGVDSFIGEAYLARVQARLPADLPVVFLPLQRVGYSEEHNAFAGTLTVSAETAIRAWTEIGESVGRAGVRKLVIVNSHGGNSPIIEIVARQLRVRHAMLAVTVSWQGFGYPHGLFDDGEVRHGIHGGEVETSIMLAARPELVRKDRLADNTPATLAMERQFKWLHAHRPASFGWMTQDLNASGAVGDARGATGAKGEAALDHGATAFIDLLRDVDRFDVATLVSRFRSS